MLSHKKTDSVINVKVDFGEGEGKISLDNIAKRAAAYKPKSVHFTNIDLNRKTEYNIVKYPIVGLVKGN